MDYEVDKSEEEWREALTPEQYHVCRKQGTERAFTGEYHGCKDNGIYHCVCCGETLFNSDHKFDSGTGWPSFDQPMDEGSVANHDDTSMGMVRTEVVCANCDAHLGHVFPDGPPSTGQRYCMNSVSLQLKKEDA